MARPVYRRDSALVEDLTICTAHMKNGDEVGLSPRRRAIVRTLDQRLTPRQRQCLYLYYSRGLNQQAIAETLGVNVSTVSRTIASGERHIARTLALLEL